MQSASQSNAELLLLLPDQAGKAALVAEESAVSAASLARAARTQAALRAAMVAAQSYNQVPHPSNHSSSSSVSNKTRPVMWGPAQLQPCLAWQLDLQMRSACIKRSACTACCTTRRQAHEERLSGSSAPL